MVPIYATVSFLSYFYYRHAVYFEVVRDCYEAFAIASFFGLLCHYTAPDLHSQKDYFRTLRPRGWVLPLSWFKKCCGGEKGICRTPRSGLTWFNVAESENLLRFSMLTQAADYLVWGLSVLLCAGLHDTCCAGYSSDWEILSGVAKSGFCACLGRPLLSLSLIFPKLIYNIRLWLLKVAASP